MHLFYDYLIQGFWIAFLVYWRLTALDVKATQRLEPAASRALRVALFGVAIFLLCVPVRWGGMNLRLWRGTDYTFFAGAALTLAGLLFCVWARVHLGRNWSSSVTIKEGHELITSGPYGLVRHPIYSGLLAAFVGTTLAIGQVRGVVGLTLISIGLLLKLRLEERWMRAQFGAKYEDYAGRVGMLVPGVR